MPINKPRRSSLLLKTGAVTSIVDYDDGYYQKGISRSLTILTDGQYSGTTALVLNAKTDNHSNACVLDNNTGLMWSRVAVLTIGPNDNGTLPWTTDGNGDGIYPLVAVANSSALAGYSDWRIPNLMELFSIFKVGGADTTTFPSYPTAAPTWTSTSIHNFTSVAGVINPSNGFPGNSTKTNSNRCLLVRGG